VHGHRWIAKPAEDKRPKRKVNPDLVESLPEDRQHFCWSCLRERQLLRALRPSVSLQVHHVIEVAAGGTDDLENLQLLCAECHAEVHRRREAFNRYRNKIAEAD
jgi:5-methylcytosine-specific restriction endonuclease McrA